MKFKKLLSATLAGIMALSMVTAVGAEETTETTEAAQPLGTKSYELIYFNSFDTEEAAQNPIKEYYYSDGSIKSATVSTGAVETKFSYPYDGNEYRAVFIDLAQDLKNENGKMLLSAGGVYEISFDVTALKSNLSLNFGCVSELNVNTVKTGVGLAPPKKGMGIGLDNTFYKENTVKNETKEIRLIVVYNPTNRYLAAAYNGWYDGTATIDNLTVRRINVDEAFVKDNCEAWYNKFNSDSDVTMTKIADIDLSGTKKVLEKGSSTDLVAYSQNLPENAKMSDVIATRNIIDNGTLNVETDDEDVVVYAGGKLKAVGVGTAKVTVTAGDSTASMLITVYDNSSKKFDCLTDSATTWIKTKDPVNAEEDVYTSKKINNVTTDFYAETAPVNIHYTKYFNGTAAALEYAANPFAMNRGKYSITESGWMHPNNAENRANFISKINAGWNDFDFVMFFKFKNGEYSSDTYVKAYVNGEYICNVKLFSQWVIEPNQIIEISSTDSLWDTYKNFEIVSLDATPSYELSAITVTSGETAITDNAGLIGKNVTVAYTLTNNDLLESQPYAAIAAVYESGTQKMMAVDVAAATVAKGDTASIENNLDLTKLSVDSSYILKVIIWNSLGEAKPIVNNVIDPFAE